MDTEPANSLDVHLTHLEELSERIEDRLAGIETRFENGFAEMRTEMRSFDKLDRKIASRSKVIILLYGLGLVLQVTATLGIVGR